MTNRNHLIIKIMFVFLILQGDFYNEWGVKHRLGGKAISWKDYNDMVWVFRGKIDVIRDRNYRSKLRSFDITKLKNGDLEMIEAMFKESMFMHKNLLF